jgi:MFS family permease
MPATLGWVRVAFAMFAVGWGANQFSTMLIVYRHVLGLGPGAVDGLFAIYGAALIPALLIGGPASDRYGRRAVVLPFVALSPLATLLLVLGGRSLPAIATGRALAGLVRSARWPGERRCSPGGCGCKPLASAPLPALRHPERRRPSPGPARTHLAAADG